MLKIRKLRIWLSMAIAICCVIGLLTTDSFAQKSGEGQDRTVTLIKNAKKNGYKIFVVETANYFEANDVEDPVTRKLLENLMYLEFRCRRVDRAKILFSILFRGGRSDRIAVPCALMIEPRIIINLEDE